MRGTLSKETRARQRKVAAAMRRRGLLTVAQAAKKANRSIFTIHGWVRDGELQATRKVGRVYVSRAALVELVRVKDGAV